MMNDTHPEIPKAPSRQLRWLLFLLRPKVAVPLMILLALLSAPFMYRMHRINMLPDIGDPFDVEAFGTVEIIDEENAFVEYRAASKLLNEMESSSEVHEELSRAVEQGWSVTSPSTRRWMQTNGAAMGSWWKGTKKPRALYHQPKERNMSTELPVTQNLRLFARMALIEGSRLEEIGRPDLAWAWYRGVYRSSRHSGQAGSAIERLVGAAMHAMSANSIEKWSRNQLLTTDQIKKAMQHLETDYLMTQPISETMKAEYLTLKISLDPDVLDEVRESINIEPLSRTEKLGLYFMGEPDLSFRVIQHVWANWLEHFDKPLSKRPSHTKTLGLFESTVKSSAKLAAEEVEEIFFLSIEAKLLIPALSQLDEAIHHEQLRHRALLVVLAAQWYQREHGEFPEKFEDLLDGYLDAIPLDPHDVKGGKLQYRRNPDGFTVWGLGTNGIDDGGHIGWHLEDDDFGYHVGKKEEQALP